MLKLDDAIAGSQMVSNNDDDDVYDNEDGDEDAGDAADDTNDICNPHISVNHIAVKIPCLFTSLVCIQIGQS